MIHGLFLEEALGDRIGLADEERAVQSASGPRPCVPAPARGLRPYHAPSLPLPRSRAARFHAMYVDKKESRFSNWRGTPKGCSRSRNCAKNAACSISCYRTAFGRMGSWSLLSLNPLTCLRKRSPRPETKTRLKTFPSAFLKNGSSSWTRTSDHSINSRTLYQLSYRGMP